MKVKTTEGQFMELASALTNQMADIPTFGGLSFEIDPRMRSVRFTTSNGTVMYYPARNLWQYKQQVFESDMAEFIKWMEAFIGDDRILQQHRRHGPTRRQAEAKVRGSF